MKRKKICTVLTISPKSNVAVVAAPYEQIGHAVRRYKKIDKNEKDRTCEQ